MNYEYNKDYYDKIYINYRRQNPPYKLLHYKEIVESFTNNSHRTLLDVGCGLGFFLKEMYPFWKVTGMEVSKYAVDRIKAELSGVNIFQAELENVILNRRFDVITAFDALEHIPNLPKALKNAYQLLRSGGLFVSSIPVYDGPFGLAVRLLDRDPTHIHKKSREFWLNILSERFEILYWAGVFRLLVLRRKYLYWPTEKLRVFSPAIIVVTAKK